MAPYNVSEYDETIIDTIKNNIIDQINKEYTITYDKFKNSIDDLQEHIYEILIGLKNKCSTQPIYCIQNATYYKKITNWIISLSQSQINRYVIILLIH